MPDEIVAKKLHIPELGERGIDIPYYEIKGRREGPQLTALAGVHGTEYASIAAAREFVRDLDPDAVSGTIVVVPIVSVTSFWARSPFVVPEDGKNLNRCFPGDPNGTFTDILAHHVFETFIRGADFMVDMHCGDLPEALEPLAIFEESPVTDASREMAIAYGLGHIVHQRAELQTGGGRSYGSASQIGIPGFVAESGQKGLLERDAIDRHVAGLTNLARFVGVLDGDPWPRREVREHRGVRTLRAERAGWWESSVELGVPVEAGDLLGTLSEVWGSGVMQIRAPEAGTPLFLTTNPAVSFDGVLLGIALD
ncbi:MAG: hypothetical protein JWO18_1967 [Microbacteriaceae bacterium]|nr:hypothetical protein [Microbacteriaceae bacterium]